MPGVAPIKIRTADGAYGTVAQKDLQQALSADAEVVSDDEFNQAAQQKEYGGLGGSAAALGLGAARGATLGLSDLAATAIGGESARKAIEGYRQANPFASGGGEVAGMLAPLVLSGGGSAAIEGAEGASLFARGVKGAGSVVRGVDALGGLAERGVAKLVGTEASSVLGRGAQRAVALGARGAVEGAAQGAFQQLDEDVLGDKPVAAEKLWAAAGKGALFAGLTGGALGFAGGASSAALEKGKSALVKRLGTEGVSEMLDKQSAEFAFRSAGGGKRVATKAEKYAGGTDVVGRIWREEAPELAGQQSFSKMTREDLGIAAKRGMEREGGVIDGALSRADEAATKAGKVPVIGDLLADVDRVKSSVMQHAGQEGLAQRLDMFADSMKRLTGAEAAGTLNLQTPVSFRQWQTLRRDADAMWGEAAKGGKTVFLDLRGEMEKSMVTRLEGLGEAQAYGAAKKKWQAFKLLDDATKNADAAAGSNRFWSLTDTIAGGAGSMVGGAIGGLPGSLVGGAVSSGLNRLVRTRGDFVMTDALKHMSTLERAQAVTQMVDTRIQSAVSGLLTRTKSATIALGSREVSKPKRERDNTSIEVAKAAGALAVNSSELMRRVQDHAGELSRHAPGVATRYAEVATRSLQYLAQEAPKQKQSTSMLQPHADNPYRMSASERSQWNSKVRGVIDPLDVIDDLGSGKVDRFAMEAIKATQPAIYAQLQDEVRRQSLELADKLPLQKQAALSRATGVPVGTMFTPEAVAAYQATYAPAEAAQEQTPSPPPGEPLQRSAKLRGPTEEIATNE